SDREQWGCEGSLAAGFDRAFENFRALVDDAHFGVRYECPAGILHHTANGAGCATLGHCLCYQCECCETDANQLLHWCRHSVLPSAPSMEPTYQRAGRSWRPLIRGLWLERFSTASNYGATMRFQMQGSRKSIGLDQM